jgi:hypothetical protein
MGFCSGGIDRALKPTFATTARFGSGTREGLFRDVTRPPLLFDAGRRCYSMKVLPLS